MRITIHLSTFDETHPCAYAIVWIDRDTQRWSRESHFGVELPAWGVVRSAPGVTRLCDPHGGAALCGLEGFELDDEYGPLEGEIGGARWCRDRGRGHWRVQCIDEYATRSQYGFFAGDLRA